MSVGLTAAVVTRMRDLWTVASAPDGTVKAELRTALGETDIELDEENIRSLAGAIEEHGEVDVAEVLS